MSKKEMIQNQLTKLAFQISQPFCYPCYTEVKGSYCHKFKTDDLMRMTKSGLDWGIDWVIEELLNKHLEPFHQTESFEQMIEDCYPTETKVGWLTLSTLQILKTMDDVSWEMAKDDYIYSLAEDEEIMSFDNGKTYFATSDIEQLIEEKLNNNIAC
ncbi:MAG: hypothetical protein OXN83_01630 [Oligoflexia bacterium]|nr:hypothetical protein [Oligoflexia bacterium]